MRKLWIIGDSFSVPFEEPKEGPDSWKNRYCNYKGYPPKFFGEIVCDKLSMGYEILTEGPNDNYRMIEIFTDNIHRFGAGDILSFGWTDLSRLRFVDTSTNKWEVVNAHNMKGVYYHNMSVDSLVEWASNRTHSLYIEELIRWTKLISSSIPNITVIHWSWINHEYFPFEKIFDETNGLVNDFHWSENGHKQFADWFLDVYNTKIKNNCLESLLHQRNQK